MGRRSSLPYRCSITTTGYFRKRAMAWLGHLFPLACGVGRSNSLSGSPPQSLPEPGPLSVRTSLDLHGLTSAAAASWV